ncbi:MAG: discoidin domain-containing protein, partial [Christensenellaceae bacterium]
LPEAEAQPSPSASATPASSPAVSPTPSPTPSSAPTFEGENFALGQSIAATSDYIAPEGFYNAQFLVDGSWETLTGSNVKLGWNTDTAVKLGETDPVDITLTLDARYALNQIVLKPMKWSNGDAFPRDYELQVSMDGKSWQTIASDTDVNAHAESNTAVQPIVYSGFDTAYLRYFRIHITRHSAQVDQSGAYTSAIGEVELYGEAAPYGKASLQAKLDEINALDLARYTLASLTPLKNAMAAAEALLAQTSPAEAQIAAAIAALEAAQAELVEKPAGNNFALNQSISATSDYIPPEGFYSAQFLVDGSWETLEGSNVKLGWNTDTNVPLAETDPVDITLALDSSYALERIVLKPMKWSNGDAFPRDYELQVSTDGKTWQTVASDTGVSAHAGSNTAVQPITYESFDPVRIRYFRVHITRHSAQVDQSGSYTSAIGEIELYGYEDGAEIVPTSINKPELLMNPGETDELYLVVDRHLPAPVVRYESSNPAVATIADDGTVTAVANGATTITLYDETTGTRYTSSVTVQRYCASDHFQIVGFIPYFYEKDINAATFDNLKNGGLTNVEINFALDAGAITYENNLKAIKLAHERGLDVTVSEADFNRNWPQKTDEEILEFAKRYSHIPGVTGYYIVDEPPDARPYARAMALVKSVMPYAVAHMNFCGAYGDNVRGLVSELNKYGSGLLDYVMYDVYCCRGENVDENSLYYWLEYNRQLGEELDTPTAAYIQSMAWGATGSGAMCNRPDADEIRYQAYASLAYGVKQLSY